MGLGGCDRRQPFLIEQFFLIEQPCRWSSRW
jgi:hypothetical protein